MLQQLTHNQQEWLDHINQALAQNLPMSAYAKQNNLSLKVFECRSFKKTRGLF